MEKHEDSQFVLGSGDDHSHEKMYQEEMLRKRLDKVGMKVTMISFILPCIIGVIFFIAYKDIKQRVSRVHDTGTTEVLNLSKDFDSRILSISKKLAELESSLANQEKAATSSVNKLKRRALRNEKDISFLSTSKPSKKTLNKVQEDIDNQITPMQISLDKLSATVSSIDKRVEDETKKVSGRAWKNKLALDKIEKNISSIESKFVGKKSFETELKKEKAFYQLKINELSKQLKANDKLIKSLQAKIKTLEAGKKGAIKPSSGNKAKTSGAAASDGKIIEQDL